MPSWKKVIISGSDAALNSLNVSTSFTASGLHYPISDNGEESFLQTDGNGNLSFQYTKTIYEEVYNGETTQLLKGTPVYVSGSVGAASVVYRADAANPAKMPVTYIIADNIAPTSTGKGIVLGLIKGIDTTGYPVGTEIYIAPGGGWASTRPTGSNIVQLLGIITKEGSGGQGVVLNPGPNSLPNLPSGSVWVGNSNSIPTSVLTSSLSVASASFASTASFTTAVSGTTNYVSKFTGTGTLGNSQIFDNGTNVGISTINPQAKLDVRAQGSLPTDIVFRVRNSTDTQNFLVVNGAGDVYNNGAGGINTNTFFGENVGRNTTGGLNTAIGYNALLNNTTGFSNTALGLNALSSNTAGFYNTAIGVNALQNNTIGYYNTAIGESALYNNTTGFTNTAIGGYALYSNTTGGNNTALGIDALYDNTIGQGNVGIGSLAGTGNVSGNGNIFVGSNTSTAYSNASNQIVIGSGAIGLGSNSVVLGNDSITKTILKGNVGIGTTSPTLKLEVNGNVRILQSIVGGGNAPSGTSYSSYAIGGNIGGYGGFFFSSKSDVDADGFGGVSINLSPDGGVNLYNYSLDYSKMSSIAFNPYDFTMQSGGDFSFQTKPSTTYQTSLFIKNTGEVGIGTTTPSSYKLNVNGDTNINGTLTATVKSFIIDHPTKPNKKLQYGVLEGPEHSVYFRGKLKGTNKIILPDYWFALVNEETITVNITPIGDKQNIWVVSTNACEIILESETEINCFYTVFAERKDINKLVTEFDK